MQAIELDHSKEEFTEGARTAFEQGDATDYTQSLSPMESFCLTASLILPYNCFICPMALRVSFLYQHLDVASLSTQTWTGGAVPSGLAVLNPSFTLTCFMQL